MMARSWYGSATLITTEGFVFLMSAATSFDLLASTTCVWIFTPQRFLISFFIALGFSIVLEARWIFVKTPAFIAHLCAVTLPTPPAPIMSTVLISQIYSLVAYSQALRRENPARGPSFAVKVRQYRNRRHFGARRLF